jgi:flagellar basal body-associated protein FliL
MKRIIRLLVILLVISSLAGITTSCVLFEESSHAQKQKPFQHQKPLPKKYVLDNGYKPIAK